MNAGVGKALGIAWWMLVAAAPAGWASQHSFAALYDLPVSQLVELQAHGDVRADLILLSLEAETQSADASDLELHKRATELAPGSDEALFLEHIRCYSLIRQPDKAAAIETCRELHRQLKPSHEPLLHVLVADSLAFVLRVVGRMPESIEYLSLAQAALPRVPSDYLAARVANTEAMILLWSGMNERAIERLQEAQSLASRFDDRPRASSLVLSVGLAYFEAGMFDQALKAFRDATEWGVLHQNSIYKMKAQLHTARTLVRLQQPQAALAKVDALSEEYGDKPIGQPLELVAEIRANAYNQLQQPERALQALEPALERLARASNMHRWGMLAPTQIESLFLLGDYTAANEFADRVVQTEGVSENVLDEALVWVARMATQSGAHEKAAQTYARALKIREAQFGEEFARRISMLQSAAELERFRWHAQLDMQRQANELENAQLRSWILGTLLVSIILLSSVLFLEHKRRVNRLITTQLRDTLAERTDALEAQVDETKLLRSRVVEDDKMRALGQLTGGVAHDYNNLLMVIQGCIDLMALDEEDLDSTRRLRETIRESVDTGRDLNNLLLSYARRRQLAPVNVALGARLTSLRPMLEKVLGPEIELVMQVPTEVVVQADPGQLTTAIINLLSNSRQACNERGRIEIIAEVAEDDLVSIAVRDFGQGMTEEQRRKAPEPFYSSKQAQVACGLGLSMVDGFVHQSGGRLRIDSQLDVGTTVYMYLPQGTLESDTGGALLPTASELPNGLNCCLVDDDAEVRSSLSKMLEKMGLRCAAFAEARSALEYITQASPDLLIGDVRMTGELGGEWLADSARASSPNTAIILVSGYAGDGEVRYPLLAKPFDYDTLRSEIQAVLALRPQTQTRSAS